MSGIRQDDDDDNNGGGDVKTKHVSLLLSRATNFTLISTNHIYRRIRDNRKPTTPPGCTRCLGDYFNYADRVR